LCQVHCICKIFSGLILLHTSRVGLSFWQIWASCQICRTRDPDCNFVILLADPCATFALAGFVLDEFSGESLCYLLFRSLRTSLSSLAFTWVVLCDLARLACLCFGGLHAILTLILLTWKIWRAPNNASRWQMGFNSAFKGLKKFLYST